ncbi:hypothetical protein RIF29_19864 [Crotalaria pallida]|uniref:Reverse transcriptase zinc-binding domain-containing protein n=1 Tax=Crotalaria pallida TaxID=3830 RepID=A0AAN9F1Z9_CROPI
MSRNPFPGAHLLVSALKSSDGSGWDSQILQQFFLPHDVEIIRSIPIVQSNRVDELIWHFTTDGVYSVKSGYKTLLQYQAHSVESGVGSSSNDAAQIWKVLWSLNLPEKMKIFWWRALRDILPTKANLLRKKMQIPSDCKSCNEMETAMHCFFYCDFAKEIWSRLNLWQSVSSVLSDSCLNWFGGFIMDKSRDSVAFAILVLWNIWNARNLREFQDVRKAADEIVFDCVSSWERVKSSKQASLANTLPVKPVVTTDNKASHTIAKWIVSATVNRVSCLLYSDEVMPICFDGKATLLLYNSTAGFANEMHPLVTHRYQSRMYLIHFIHLAQKA